MPESPRVRSQEDASASSDAEESTSDPETPASSMSSTPDGVDPSRSPPLDAPCDLHRDGRPARYEVSIGGVTNRVCRDCMVNLWNQALQRMPGSKVVVRDLPEGGQ